jgi:biopolymer transport protein ExbD
MIDPTKRFEQFTTKPSGGGLNIVPLIDVMFLLLAVYIATSLSMVYQSAVAVNLAGSDSGKPQSQEVKTATVTVKDNGDYFLDRNEVSVAALQSQLQELARTEPNKVIQLNADKNTRHELVVGALDIIRASGITNVSLLVEPKETSAK